MLDLQQRIAAIRQRLESIERAHPNALLAAWITTLIVGVAILGGSTWLVYDIFHDLPTTSELRDVGSMAQATTLYDRNNQPAFTIFQERRIERPLSDISPHLVDAVIAVEDQRFYEHRGIDLIRVFAAAAANLREHRAAQGGSTLTQQLARQSFLTSDKTLRRKVKEAILAWRLEREFTKQQLLEMYLNKVYFGDGLYGVEAASLGFFGKHARDVDVSEAALLAGLVKSPSTYAPTINLERAVARRNVVLQAMRDTRVIDAATYQIALRSQPHLADALRSEETYGQYFKEEVRKQLVQRFGWERVYIGGLKVYTTLDPAMQQAAEGEVARSLAEIEKRQLNRVTPLAPSTDPLQAALVALDPTTGEVRAMVGGRNFDQSRFNRATQARRQAGSAFKPFVYASALEQGFTAATVITGLDNPIATLQGAWVPDDHGGSGDMTMRAALKTSSNRAAVQMLQQIGIPTAVRYAERLGVGGLPEVPSLALGSGEVTLMSMTAAYSAFANQGMFAQPSLIRRVDDSSGEVLYMSSTREDRVTSEATAFIMTSMMSDVINGGTAWQARRVGFTLPAAGKTGTTNDYRDAWFVGFTPHLVTGVWIGYDMPRTIIANGYAGELAVPLWGRFMEAATRNDKPDRFTMPATVVPVTVCRLSGKLPTAGCESAVMFDRDGNPTDRSMLYTEYFVRGTEPTDYCPLHRGLDVLASSGDAQTGSAVTATSGTGTPQQSPTDAATGGAHPAQNAPPAAVPAASMPDPSDAQPPKRGFWGRIFRR
ncbi:MAG TPA: PBP1A family penicillin-binding protein [Vicinamibacterales bacterium]|nr:PBP1A family penicillin-binding protein [Vicinamibacterales bacterium]